jgi:superfamily II DNA or RNA helicase
MKVRLQPRGWQKQALAKWLESKAGVVSVVTGGGKTVFALLCAQAVRESFPETKTVILVPTLTLLDQWYVCLLQDAGIEPCDVALFSGHHKEKQLKAFNVFVINTARTALRALATGSRVLLIADECHRLGSPINAHCLSSPFDFRLGLSATPEREHDEGFRTIIRPALGDIIFTYDYKSAFADEVICPFRLVNVKIQLQTWEQQQYADLTKRIAVCVRRYEAGDSGAGERLKLLLRKRARVSASAVLRIPVAAKLALRERGQRTLIFHEDIRASDKISALLQSKGVQATRYHSRIGSAMRQNNLLLFRQGVFRVLTCCRALDEGLNVPETNVGIIASSTASIRQRIQRLGRMLRPSKNKPGATIYTLFATESERKRLQTEAQNLSEITRTEWLELK